MSTAQISPIAEVNRRAIETLIREIGVVDTIRFLNQFRTGSGDYTRERDAVQKGKSIDDLIAEINERSSRR